MINKIQLSNNTFKLIFLLIILIGIGLRLYYMLTPLTKLSVDESVYGVQALNILTKGENSVFYYNQNYTGTFSAYLTVFLFFLFGVHSLLVKLPILVASIGFLLSSYFLGKKIFSTAPAGLMVLILTAVTSPFWMNWTTRAGTGYPETMLLGNIIYLVLLKNLFGKLSINHQSISFFLIGLMGGLGYWVQPTIIYYLFPAALFIFFWKPKIFMSRLFYLGIIGFIIGSAPVLIFNFGHQNLNTASLFHKPFGVKSAMVNFFTVGLPVIFGLRKTFSTVDFNKYLTIVVSLTYAGAFLWLLVERFGALIKTFSFNLLSKKPRLKINFESLKPIDLIFVFFIALFIVFSLSSPFNQMVDEPRYISPLYTGLPILIVYLVFKLNKINFFLAGAVFLLVLGSQIWGLVKIPPSAYQSQFDIKNVIQVMNQLGIKYVYTTADFSYRIILETSGKITAVTTDWPPIEARYPLYRQLVESAPKSEKAFLVTKPMPLVPCGEDVNLQEGPCRETKVGIFYIITWK